MAVQHSSALDSSARPGGGMDVKSVGSDAWAETISAAVASCDVRVERAQSFHAVVDARSFADLEFIDVTCGRHTTSRTRSHVEADASASLFMVIPLRGEFRLSQDGRLAVLDPGAVSVFDSERPAAVETSEDFRGLCLKIPHRLLGYPGENLAKLTARRLADPEGAVSVVRSMLIGLYERIDVTDISAQFKLVRAVVGLVEALLASVDPSRTAEAQRAEVGVEEVQRYVERHLGDPELSPRVVAAANFMSIRRLHYLFEESGTTVSAWIRERRVARCKEDLATRGLLTLPISVVARKWGFRTTSHFGQVFKASTGMTPRDFRNLHTGMTRDQGRDPVVENAASDVDYAGLNHVGWSA